MNPEILLEEITSWNVKGHSISHAETRTSKPWKLTAEKALDRFPFGDWKRRSFEQPRKMDLSPLVPGPCLMASGHPPPKKKVGDMAMGQKPVAPVNIPIPTNTGSKMGGAPTPKMGSHWF